MINSESKPNQYKTIYIGGGTPNFLSSKQLDSLLSCLHKYIDRTSQYEFTIECNPEFITNAQALQFKNYHINRVSLGAQTLNNKILKSLNRSHTREQIGQAVDILKKQQITNISCDFIYAIKGLQQSDIADCINFVIAKQIPHISYYALEVKSGSRLNQEHYLVDVDIEGEQLDYIERTLAEHGYQRYEVSNWVKHSGFESEHNKAYWLSQDWKGVGWGAHGFENKIIYDYRGQLLDWKINRTVLKRADLYFQILMMGLRLVNGIDIINVEQNRLAYKFYKSKLTNCEITNGHLKAKNLDLLHDILLNLID